MRSPYEGPIFSAYPSEEVQVEYGVRLPNGTARPLRLGEHPPLDRLVRRRVVPIEDWKEVLSEC